MSPACQKNLENEHVSIKNELQNIMSVIEKESKLILFAEDDAECYANSHSIDYLPTNKSEAQNFMSLLLEEGLLRELDVIDKSMEDLRLLLKGSLKKENNLVELKKRLDHCTIKEGISFVMLQFVPCILHLETRCGLKIITMLLREGLANARGNKIESLKEVTSTVLREKTLMERIENVINNSILGHGFNKYQFKIPLEPSPTGESGQVIGVISLENTKVRSIMNDLETIIDACIIDEEKRSKWISLVSHYRHALIVLRKKENAYTNDDIMSFQTHIDIFAQHWIALHQDKGLTNYLHLLMSGHAKSYVKEWGNLHNYSQQGWEALNSLVKLFFFRRTNKGGGKHKTRSRLDPIASLIQRRLLWMSGLAEKFVRNCNNSDNMEGIDDSCTHD